MLEIQRNRLHRRILLGFRVEQICFYLLLFTYILAFALIVNELPTGDSPEEYKTYRYDVVWPFLNYVESMLSAILIYTILKELYLVKCISGSEEADVRRFLIIILSLMSYIVMHFLSNNQIFSMGAAPECGSDFMQTSCSTYVLTNLLRHIEGFAVSIAIFYLLHYWENKKTKTFILRQLGHK